MSRTERFLLINGPRKAGKTISVLNNLCGRAWRFESTTSVIATTSTVAVDGGVWDLLTNNIVPQWVDGNFGFEWVRQPYKEASTQKHKFKIRNMHGTSSTFQLDSLADESKHELKFKSRSVQTIYVAELSNFKQRTTFDTWVEFLRLPPGAKGMTKEDCQLIADTNPSDEGEDSWIYKLWYVLLNSKVEPGHPDYALKQNLGLMEFTIADNPYLSQAELELLYSQYGHDANLKARYLEGKWVKATSKGLFQSVWRPAIHVYGESPSIVNENPPILLPEPKCSVLDGGWDLGNRNHAMVIGETWPMMVQRAVRQKDGTEKVEWAEQKGFKILDEKVLLKEMVKVEEFTESVMDLIRFWASQCESPPMWEHFSDKSAWRFDAKSDRFEHEIVYQASGGEIQLVQFDNFPNTIAPCIRLIRKLLFEERIIVNKARCPMVIEMFGSLPYGPLGDQSVPRDHEFKHIFDAVRYWICSRAASEIQESSFKPNFQKPASAPVMVAL